MKKCISITTFLLVSVISIPALQAMNDGDGDDRNVVVQKALLSSYFPCIDIPKVPVTGSILGRQTLEVKNECSASLTLHFTLETRQKLQTQDSWGNIGGWCGEFGEFNGEVRVTVPGQTTVLMKLTEQEYARVSRFPRQSFWHKIGLTGVAYDDGPVQMSAYESLVVLPKTSACNVRLCLAPRPNSLCAKDVVGKWTVNDEPLCKENEGKATLYRIPTYSNKEGPSYLLTGYGK